MRGTNTNGWRQDHLYRSMSKQSGCKTIVKENQDVLPPEGYVVFMSIWYPWIQGWSYSSNHIHPFHYHIPPLNELMLNLEKRSTWRKCPALANLNLRLRPKLYHCVRVPFNLKASLIKNSLYSRFILTTKSAPISRTETFAVLFKEFRPIVFA